MLGFMTILAACICGYGGATIWTMPVAAATLVMLSYAENFALYRRGVEAGMSGPLEDTLWRSVLNAVVATGAAYGFGSLLRMIGGV